jgi:fluoride exporter
MTCRACQAVSVGLGAALGSAARAGLALVLIAAAGPALPWGTLAANVTGSFLIGFLAAATEPGARWPAGVRMRLFLIAGVCGGFTTFSVFSLELVALWSRSPNLFALVLALSLPGWMLAVWAGHRLGRSLDPAPPSRA